MDADAATRIIAYFREVQGQARRHAATTMRSASSGTEAAKAIVEEAAAFYDGYLEGLTPPFRPACAEGCDFCCYQYVSATIPEVVALAAFILEAWSPEEREQLLEQLEAYRRESRRMTPAQVAGTKRACPLLREGRCRVYSLRPLACRGYHSMDVAACRECFSSRTPVQIPTDIRGALTTQLSRGIAEGVKKNGCTATSVGLVAGLVTVLRDPGVAEAWHRGKRVFEEASDKALRRAMPDLDVTPA